VAGKVAEAAPEAAAEVAGKVAEAAPEAAAEAAPDTSSTAPTDPVVLGGSRTCSYQEQQCSEYESIEEEVIVSVECPDVSPSSLSEECYELKTETVTICKSFVQVTIERECETD
jgi:hypothetical protein